MPTTTATITAAQLAEMLLTYGDMPVVVHTIDCAEGDEWAAHEGTEQVHLEIVTDMAGSRSVAVVAYNSREQ